jgi:hypothetical protein
MPMFLPLARPKVLLGISKQHDFIIGETLKAHAILNNDYVREKIIKSLRLMQSPHLIIPLQSFALCMPVF